MKGIHLIILSCFVLLTVGCGKKAPPRYHVSKFNMMVESLVLEERNGTLILKGKISDTRNIEKLKGCRIYLSEYDPEDRPCPKCPIKYQRYYEQGMEVFKGNRFVWRLSGVRPNKVYMFKVRLINRDGALGPSSDMVEILTSNR